MVTKQWYVQLALPGFDYQTLPVADEDADGEQGPYWTQDEEYPR